VLHGRPALDEDERMHAAAEERHPNDAANVGVRAAGTLGELQPGGRIAGRYRIEAPIGAGGMATVYRAHDERLGRDVAIKLCRPAAGEPAPPLREERVSSSLMHASIVSIFDAGEIPPGEPGAGSRYIVMQYVDGTTAAAVAPVPWRRAMEIARQAAAGLAAAHARGIVHCDVKPSNILIDRHDRALVADFGVAAVALSEVGDYVHGSPAFVAPERLAGEPPDPRVDVFGLGGVLAWLLARQVPEAGRVPALPDDCPPELAAIIARARARDPRARYADAAAFRAALDAVAARDTLSRYPQPLDAAPTLAVRVVQRPARVIAPSPNGTIQVPAVAGQPAVSAGVIRAISVPLPSRVDQRRRVPWIAAAVVCGLLLLLAVAAIVGDGADDGQLDAGAEPAAAAFALPDVQGQSFEDAIGVLVERGLAVERVEVVYGPGPLNQVVAQDPAPGEDVARGDDVTLVVRTGR
jgi:serine/threonine-protein kinase